LIWIEQLTWLAERPPSL